MYNIMTLYEAIAVPGRLDVQLVRCTQLLTLKGNTDFLED